MKLDEFLLNYFDEEGIRTVCVSLRVQASGSMENVVKAIITTLDAINEFDKAEGAMEAIFDCAFDLDDAVLKKVLSDAKLDACGSKMALLNRVMANLVWPSSIEAQVNKESKLTGDMRSIKIYA